MLLDLHGLPDCLTDLGLYRGSEGGSNWSNETIFALALGLDGLLAYSAVIHVGNELQLGIK